MVDGAGHVVDTIARAVPMSINHRRGFVWNGHLADGRVAPQRPLLRAGHAHPPEAHDPDHQPEHRAAGAGDRRGRAVPDQGRLGQGRRCRARGHPAAERPADRDPLHRRRHPAARPSACTAPTWPARRSSSTRSTRQRCAPRSGTGRPRAGTPAPQGTYQISVSARDRACSISRFPVRLPAPPGSTPHDGVTVRYLAAQPPMTAVKAGSTVTVAVDSRRHRYRWALRRVGSRTVLGTGRSAKVGLKLKIAGRRFVHAVAALGLAPHRGADRRRSDRRGLRRLGASSSGLGHRRVLVVLPALTWQGENPVDDDGDGTPNLLTTGGPIQIQRPFTAGLPAGFASEAGLIAYLRASGLQFTLTTDLSLISRRPLAALALLRASVRRQRALAAGGDRLGALHLGRAGRPRPVVRHRRVSANGDDLRRPGERPLAPARGRLPARPPRRDPGDRWLAAARPAQRPGTVPRRRPGAHRLSPLPDLRAGPGARPGCSPRSGSPPSHPR